MSESAGSEQRTAPCDAHGSAARARWPHGGQITPNPRCARGGGDSHEISAMCDAIAAPRCALSALGMRDSGTRRSGATTAMTVNGNSNDDSDTNDESGRRQRQRRRRQRETASTSSMHARMRRLTTTTTMRPTIGHAAITIMVGQASRQSPGMRQRNPSDGDDNDVGGNIVISALLLRRGAQSHRSSSFHTTHTRTHPLDTFSLATRRDVHAVVAGGGQFAATVCCAWQQHSCGETPAGRVPFRRAAAAQPGRARRRAPMPRCCAANADARLTPRPPPRTPALRTHLSVRRPI